MPFGNPFHLPERPILSLPTLPAVWLGKAAKSRRNNTGNWGNCGRANSCKPIAASSSNSQARPAVTLPFLRVVRLHQGRPFPARAGPEPSPPGVIPSSEATMGVSSPSANALSFRPVMSDPFSAYNPGSLPGPLCL